MTGVPSDQVLFEQGPWLEVDLDSLRRNARTYSDRVGVPLLPMVKANGYGLGAVSIVAALEPLAPWGFGVATIAEAAELRQAGVVRPVVAFLPFVTAAAPAYRRFGVRPALGGPAEVAAWLAGGVEPFHLAIDTGMGRGGVSWHDEESLGRIGELLRGAPGYEGVFTHFHSADTDETATAGQWDRFVAAVARVGSPPPLIHAANSAAGRWGGRFAGTLARPGIFLYGGEAGPCSPEPVVRLVALVHAVRPIGPGETISYGATFQVTEPGEVLTLGVGYADGLLRSLSNRGLVAIGSRRYPIAGRITMDMTMVVVPPGTASVGDRLTLFGGEVSLDEQAGLAGTISYELLTAVGRRVRRHYRGEQG